MKIYALFAALLLTTAAVVVVVFRDGGQRRSTPVILAGVTGVLSWVMWQWSDPPVAFSDFAQAYYPAGRAIVEDVSRLYTRIAACEATAVCGFVNLPIVAFLFTPLAAFSPDTAQELFALLSLLWVGLTVGIIWSMSPAPMANKYLVVLLFALNGPLFYSLKEGNLTHLTLLFLVAAVALLQQERDEWAGVCFAAAAIIKLPLLLFGVFFVFTRRWASARGFALTLIGVASVSLLYAGWSSHTAWYREAIAPFAHKGLSAFNVQSIDGFLLRMSDQVRLYDWKPAAISDDVRIVRQFWALVVIGLSCFLWTRHPGADPKQALLLDLCMVLCVALMISPISWTHYYLFLLLPLSLYIGHALAVPLQRGWVIGMLFSAVLISPPVTFVNPTGWIGNAFVRNLVISHYLVGAILLWLVLGLARLRLARVSVPQVSLLPASSERTAV